MGRILRTFLYMVLGFSIPAGLSFLAYSHLNRDHSSETVSSNSVRMNEGVFDAPEMPFTEVEPVAEEHYFQVSSDQLLDPQKENSFLIAISFRLDELPPANSRQRIIAKYEPDIAPYSGWAIGLFSYQTSVRPAIYWKGTSGKGGWFVFGEVDLKVGETYHSLFSLTKQEQLLGFWKDSSQTDRKSFRFIGGYDVSPVGLPKSESTLYYGVRGSRQTSFRGIVQKVIVASPAEQYASRSGLQRLLSGSLESLVERIQPNDLYLYVNSSGIDSGGYTREVTSSKNI